MALRVASASRRLRSLEKVAAAPRTEGVEEDVRRRNRELEEELDRSREREEAARRELERTRERLRISEEAEERLCSQMGELEAECVQQARAYQLQIQSLMDQLSRALQLQQQRAAAAVLPPRCAGNDRILN